VKLLDLFRRLGERFLRRPHSSGSNGAAHQPQDQAPPPPAEEVPWAEEEVYRMNPLYARSREAFYRNLSDLLKTHEEEWVAYHGDEFVIATKTDDEAWDHCLRLGLKRGEFAVLFVHNPERMDYDTELGYAGEL
jgi:hypothetical protein